MSESLITNTAFVLSLFIFSFFYWYRVNTKIKSYYRSYDYVLLTIIVGFFLSRFFGVVLDLSTYTSNGFGLAPFMQSLNGDGVELSTSLPWSIFKLGDGNYFFSAFVFAPYITHIIFRKLIEVRPDWRQQCSLFVEFGVANLIIIDIYRVFIDRITLFDLNLFSVELFLGVIILAILFILKFNIGKKISLIRYNKISIMLLDIFAMLYIAYFVYKDIGTYILGIIFFGVIFYINYFVFIKDHFIKK